MNTCYIFGSLNVDNFTNQIDETDFVIAADKGILNTQRFNLLPDLIVGDFDSLEYVPEGKNVIQHPVMKDDTDLVLAVKIGFEQGYKNFIIYGCLGGDRLDHTFASIQTAAFIKEKGGNAVFYDGDTCISLHQNETITFPPTKQGIISVFSYTETAVVSEKNLLYELDKCEITQKHPIGVSNEFIGKQAEITVHSGSALIICKETNEV